MGAEQKVDAVQLNTRLCGVSPPVTRRLLITEQAISELVSADAFDEPDLRGLTLSFYFGVGLLRRVKGTRLNYCRLSI